MQRYPNRGRMLAPLLTLVLAAGCAGERPGAGGNDGASADDGRPVIAALGTSLTAGLGVDPSEAWPALLQRKLDSAGLDYRVQNAGVSGETSAGALARIDWVLRQPASVLIVETGANDGLRGLDPAALAANLDSLLARARDQDPDMRLVVVGMEAPPNLGPRYTAAFRAVYPDVARKHGAVLVPFLLDQVAGIDTLNVSDGIHPNPSGHAIMAETVWRAILPLLQGDAA